MVLNAGSVSVGELLIRLRISALAACCARASLRSRVRLSSCCRRSAVEERRRRGSALRRFCAALLRLRALVGLLLALERRRIAHPKGLGLRRFSKWHYSRDLRLEKWGSESHFRVAANLEAQCPLYPRKRTSVGVFEDRQLSRPYTGFNPQWHQG